jgi:hypothetical protein
LGKKQVFTEERIEGTSRCVALDRDDVGETAQRQSEAITPKDRVPARGHTFDHHRQGTTRRITEGRHFLGCSFVDDCSPVIGDPHTSVEEDE